ncbi:MAG: type II toxin-antitoxin system RelE/ParE family toxin [Cyclobacteriaceae bacterium]|nr:type II toxin-antitoxin system RelE/ParE family toxin [Cyclobacteriaceae bacterium]
MRGIVLSKRAAKKLDKLLNYLESEWSERVKINYVEKFDQIVNQLRTFPEIGQETELVKGLRRLVITKQTTIYYRYDNKYVKIAAIFDTRMDPMKIKKEIK